MYPPYGLPHGGVILHRGFLGALLCAALGKPGRLLRNPLRESPAAPSPALQPLPMSALAAR
jgi:hypothetical protein